MLFSLSGPAWSSRRVVMLVVVLWVIITLYKSFHVEASPSTDKLFYNVTGACSATTKTLKFLQAAPLSGSNAPTGAQMREGILAAFYQYNHDPDNVNVQLVLDTKDDKYTVTESVKVMDQFAVGDEYFAVIGSVGGPNAQESVKITSPRKIPFIGPKAGVMKYLRVPFDRYSINFRASYVDETAAMVELMLALGRQRIAVFQQNDSFGDESFEGISGALSSSNLHIHSRTYYTKNSNGAALEAEVNQAIHIMNSTGAFPPDAIMVVAVTNAATVFCMRVRSIWPDVYLAGLAAVNSDLLIPQLGNNNSALLKNLYLSQIVPLPTNYSIPVVREFRDALIAMGSSQSPNVVGLEAYLAARLMIAGLESSNGLYTREAFLDGLYAHGFADLHGIRCGPMHPPEIEGGCNQCSHEVTLTKVLPNQTVVLVDEVEPYFRFSTCGYQAKVWQRLTFAQTCDFSGPAAVNCISFRDGILSAFREVNDAGGIRGTMKLELTTFDDKGSSTTSLDANLNYLKDADIFALLGTSSEVIGQIAHQAAAYKKPLFGAYSGSRDIRAPFNRYAINFRASRMDELVAILHHLYDHTTVRRVSVLYENSQESVTGRDELVKALEEKRLSLTSEGKYDIGSAIDNAVNTVFRSAKTEPQAIVFLGKSDVLDQVLLQVHAINKDVYIFATSGVVTTSLQQLLVSAHSSDFIANVNLGRLLCTTVVPPISDSPLKSTDLYLKALKAYDVYAQASLAGYEGYLVGQLLATSLQRVIGTSLTAVSMVEALYDSGNFNLQGIRCGPFVGDFTNSSDDGSTSSSRNAADPCNQCMKRVWFVSIGPGTIHNTEVPFTFSTCMYNLSPNVDFQLYGMRLAFVILASLGIVFVLVVATLLLWYHKHPLIHSSLKFSLVSCMGAIICFGYIFVLYVIPTDTVCRLSPWVNDVGFVTLFGPVFSKTYRIDKLVNNKKMAKIRITDAHVMGNFFSLLIVFLVFLGIWTLVSPNEMNEAWTPGGLRYETCVSPVKVFQYIDYALKALMLLWGCFLCTRVYKLSGSFARLNESKQIAICICNMSFLALIALLLGWSLEDPNLLFMSSSILLIVNTLFSVSVLFGHSINEARLNRDPRNFSVDSEHTDTGHGLSGGRTSIMVQPRHSNNGKSDFVGRSQPARIGEMRPYPFNYPIDEF